MFRFPLSLAVILSFGALAGSASASLTLYDASVADDSANNGLVPVATLTSQVTVNGSNNAAFNFGATSGEVTMEFILEGDPIAGGQDGYLAVGSNSSSSLRYEQWNDTSQLGFTQSGVADYVFNPAVLSPAAPVHIAYAWDNDGRMQLYYDGTLVGERTGVAASFAMPTGNGFLGNNAGNSEGMVGTIYRVTVYDELIGSAAILRHSDAYNGVTNPPTINTFAASPEAYVSPGSSTLSWGVSNFDTLDINGTNVTALPNLVVFPAVTTTYTLTATNSDGPSSAQVTVMVDPPPTIASFTADRSIVNAGEMVTLSWQTEFAGTLSIAPGIGDVSGQTDAGGAGSIDVSLSQASTFVLTVGNASGSVNAQVMVDVAMVATHPVISEFMADNETTLTDGDGDFSDWIEIFNPTGSAINLAGYFLTDDSGDLTQWAFPSTVLQPGGRIVVFASNKFPAGPAGELHTNFRMNSAGEYLALVDPDGTTILHEFASAFPAQGNDISYGIIGGDLAREQFMGVPTPGGLNDDTLPAPDAVIFTPASQTFTGSLPVSLASPTNGATIYYTSDGSVPSAGNGTVYSSAVTLSSTTALRAVAVFGGQAGALSGESYVRLATDLANYESDLPILIIENFGSGSIPAKGWSGTGSGVQQVARIPAVWATFDRDAMTGMASAADAPQMMSRIGIRGRGAFSSTWSQKPYSVEAWDQENEETDVEVLDMPGHSDWILYYPDTDDNKDPSMMFNTFMYELSTRMGRYAARFRWVEAFVNENGGDLSLSDRRGVYAIMEKVSRGKGRLDFERLSADGTTGGWLLGLNRMDSIPVGGWPAENGATRPQFFHTAGPNRTVQTSPNSAGGGDDIPRQSNGYLNFDNPNGNRITAVQRAAIEDWFTEFEDVLYDNALWLDPVNGYRKYLDPQDFVEYFIFNNLSRNGDGMLISMFPWKSDKDGKLRMGPAWDYNWSSYYIGGGSTGTKWHRRDRLWYGRLFTDPDFEQLYIDRWFFHRDGVLSNVGIADIVDGQANEIGAARAVQQGISSESTWNSRVNTFKSWLTTRADWYDGQFTARPIFNMPGGEVSSGFVVNFSPPPGIIWFTTDGSDPRAPGGSVAQGAQQFDGGVVLSTVVATGADIRVLVPTASNPASPGLGWTAIGFNDNAWSPGTTGIGYDRAATYDAEISFNLDSTMDTVNQSVYSRIEFNITDPSNIDVLNLKMKYDDGFIAYLNGVRIASANGQASPVWNSGATGSHSDSEAVQFLNFDVSAFADDLVAGTNVLAVHGLNNGVNSSDFLMVPELEIGESTVASGLQLNESIFITARTQAGNEWSAPSSAYFFVDTVPADASNLVISEMHYRPADASPSEITAGFPNRDSYEFLELMNSGAQTLNLTDVRFLRVGTEGMEFDFSTSLLRTLDPGERLLLVSNQDAFELRYGTGMSNRIAGEYSGNLSNDGELITVVDALDATIHQFSYNDKSPWPEGADGDGFSLVLIDPDQSPVPDHGDPFSWRASLSVGGSPGDSDATNYTAWKLLNGIPTPEVDLDPDNDGAETFLEYATGSLPNDASDGAASSPAASLETVAVGGIPDVYFVFRVQRNLAADDVAFAIELSGDLASWAGDEAVFLGSERTGGSSVETLSFRSANPVGVDARLFGRLRVTER